jgi:hypothetical protein
MFETPASHGAADLLTVDAGVFGVHGVAHACLSPEASLAWHVCSSSYMGTSLCMQRSLQGLQDF